MVNDKCSLINKLAKCFLNQLTDFCMRGTLFVRVKDINGLGYNYANYLQDVVQSIEIFISRNLICLDSWT